MPPQSLSLNRSSRAAAPYLFLSQSVDICLCIFPLYTRIESDWRVYKNDQQSYHPNVDSHKHTHSHTHLRVYKSFWIVFSFRCIPKSFSMGDENATPISSLRERSTRTLTLARTCMCLCICVSVCVVTIETAIVIVSSCIHHCCLYLNYYWSGLALLLRLCHIFVAVYAYRIQKQNVSIELNELNAMPQWFNACTEIERESRAA